ncbi:MAG: hypothetical protein LIO71_01835 [Ruminococcus sp.]|nr:hypothetical protein [Ruminococcus sp.]MCD7799796.1 hypothetical protein [Ruminococcus sp.]
MRYAENSFYNGKRLISILLLTLILCGVVCGVWLMHSNSEAVQLHNAVLTQGFVKDASYKTLLDVFFNAMSWTSYSLILLYLCGYSAISQPVSLFILFARGVALGVSSTTIYLEYGSKGILILLSMVMFHAVVSSVVLVFAVIQALMQSTMIAYNIFGRSFDSINVKRYNINFIVYAIVITVSSAIDTSLTYLLTNKLLIS